MATVDDYGDPERSTADPADEPPELDTMFALLKNERRRECVRDVHRNGATSLGDLARRIAAIEYDVDRPELVTSQERKRVYIGLYQCHLGQLDEADVVEYYPNRGAILPGTYLDDVVAVLEAAEAADDQTEAADGPDEEDDPDGRVARWRHRVGL